MSGTLALGVAAAMLTATVAWRVWLAPMPWPDPDRVVRLYEIEPLDEAIGVGAETRRHQFSWPLIEDMRAQSWRTLDGVSAMLFGELKLDIEEATVTVPRLTLSPEGFGILGIVPALGRLPSSDAESELMISERFWHAHFGDDPDVVGSRISTGGTSLTVVGVARLPAGLPAEPDVVNAIGWDGGASQEQDRMVRFIDAIARVKADHSNAEAQDELNAFLGAMAEKHPAEEGWRVEAVLLADDLVGPFREVLGLLLAAGCVFLLLSGINTLGLVAARRVELASDRGIRLALGASEGRLFRDAIVESLLLAAVGSSAGVVISAWLIRPMRALVPVGVPRLTEIGVSPQLAAGGLAIGVVVGIAIGTAGYFLTRGTSPSRGRASAWSTAGSGGRHALLVGQVALTTVLTAATVAILVRASTLRGVDLGFEPTGVAVTTFSIGTEGTPNWRVLREVLKGLREQGLPAAAAYNIPMAGEDQYLPPFPIPTSSADQLFYQLHLVSPAYFAVMGVDLIAGRPFGDSDEPTSEKVAILSEDFVQRYYGSEAPFGDIVGTILENVALLRGPARVVGIARSTRHHGPDAPVMPAIYVPSAQVSLGPRDLLVRGRPDQVAAGLSAVVPGIDGQLRWEPPRPYEQYLVRWFAPLRLQVITIAVLGLIGLLLASLGLYVLMAYQVASRRRELGVKKAVGATDGRLMADVLGSGAITTAAGTLLGLGLWYQCLPWIERLLDAPDRIGWLLPSSVVLVVGGSCLLATLVPAIGAMRVDPVETLKAD